MPLIIFVGSLKPNFDTLYRYADSIVNLAKVLALSDTRNSYGLQDIAEKNAGFRTRARYYYFT